MVSSKEDIREFTNLLSGDLENGEIEKVVSLFQYNKDLYQTIGILLSEGNMFVRLGVNLVLEELKEIKPDEVLNAIPLLEPLLSHENATVRGDAADLIGLIGNPEHIELIKPLLDDVNPQVREVVLEAIENLQKEPD